MGEENSNPRSDPGGPAIEAPTNATSATDRLQLNDRITPRPHK
jgi:hypothetical protein